MTALSITPDYVSDREAILREFTIIEKRISEFEILCRAPITFDEKQNEELDNNAKHQVQEISILLSKAGDGIKRFNSLSRLSDADRTIVRNIQKSLALKWQNISKRFRLSQESYLKRNNIDTSFDLDDASKYDEFDPVRISQREQEVLDIEKNVEEREKAILEIAKSIVKLNQMFKDLSILVVDQRTMLDRIDVNIVEVKHNTEIGVDHLKSAEKYKNLLVYVNVYVLL